MSDKSPDILRRLDRCEMELEVTRGYIKALEYGLHAVIASHAAPDSLAELWSHVLPDLADVHVGGAAPSPLFEAAFQQALAGLSQHIQGAAERQAGGIDQV